MSDPTAELVAFFGEQIDEDERIALNAPRHDWTILLARDAVTGEQTEQRVLDHVMQHDPGRILREVEAKRRILREYQQSVSDLAIMTRIAADDPPALLFVKGMESRLRTVVELMMLPYADRPGHQEAWRPE